MAKAKNQGGAADMSAGIDSAALVELSNGQLLEIAKQHGIEVAPEAENEVIIKAITDFVEHSEKPEGSGGDPPAPNDDNDPPSVLTASSIDGQKQRIKCDALRGKNINIGNGTVVQVDENGFFEVGGKEAARLLTIPGYEKA